MLRFSLQKPSLPLAPISRLGSSWQTIFHFDYSSERFMAFTAEPAILPARLWWGKTRISWDKRCRRPSAGGFRVTFQCPFLALREFKLPSCGLKSMGQILIFFVTLSFYILALMWYSRKKCKAVFKEKAPISKKWDPVGASVNQRESGSWSREEGAWERDSIKMRMSSRDHS